MNTETLIAIQVFVVMLIAIGMLAMLLLRQKKTIAKLQTILTEFKDDISGDSVARYFQLELDNTTAHCRQETVALKPDLPPEDMAISLRFIALQTELALVQDHIGTNTPWREQIKHYEALAQKIHELIRARVDHTARTLNDAHNEELGAKDQAMAELQARNDSQQQQLNDLKPLRDFIETATANPPAPNEMEQQLHRALLSLCENFTGTEQLRELSFLLHEAFNNAELREQAGEAPAASAEPQRKPVSIDPTQNIDMLNNIINKQNDTIRTLRKQIDNLTDAQERTDLHQTVDTMQSDIDSSENCLRELNNGIEFQPPALNGENEDMHRAIEKFTEESASMVEKIHLLSNENKQLMLENEAMRASLETDADGDDPMVAGLKLKIEKQSQEIIQLNHNFKDLEEKYLALYAEKTAS